MLIILFVLAGIRTPNFRLRERSYFQFNFYEPWLTLSFFRLWAFKINKEDYLFSKKINYIEIVYKLIHFFFMVLYVKLFLKIFLTSVKIMITTTITFTPWIFLTRFSKSKIYLSHFNQYIGFFNYDDFTCCYCLGARFNRNKIVSFIRINIFKMYIRDYSNYTQNC